MRQESHKADIREGVLKLTLLTFKAASLLSSDGLLLDDVRKYALVFLLAVHAGRFKTETPFEMSILESFVNLTACLRIAQSMPKCNSIDFKRLHDAYSIIYKAASELKSVSHEAPPIPTKGLNKLVSRVKEPSVLGKERPLDSSRPLSERQNFILRFAQSHNRFQLKDLTAHFPSYSEKTIRNDLIGLCEGGFVGRFGVAPRSYYEVVRNAVMPSFHAEPVQMNAETLIVKSEAAVERAEMVR